jgi:hypothetical protein
MAATNAHDDTWLPWVTASGRDDSRRVMLAPTGLIRGRPCRFAKNTERKFIVSEKRSRRENRRREAGIRRVTKQCLLGDLGLAEGV